MRVLLLPGWGFKTGVFGKLRSALGNGYEFDQADEQSWGGNDVLPDALAQQASSADLLIGWSLGGLQALSIALQQPGLTGRIVLLSTTPCFTGRLDWEAGMPESVFNEFRQLVMSDAEAGLKQFVRLNAGARMNPETRTQLSDNIVELQTETLAAGLDILETTDLRDKIGAIRSKVLIMQAHDDRLVSPQAGQWLSDRLPRAELAEFRNGGHAFFLSQPARVAEVIQQWI